jgi:small subunit ribosomal protein S4
MTNSMNKKNKKTSAPKRNDANAKGSFNEESESRSKDTGRQKKLSEYGKQLKEKQKVKEMYGMLEKQFRRFFKIAIKQQGATGANFLSLLERRLDNVLYRLKMSVTRRQARQVIVHGHVMVNGTRVYTPSFLVNQGDVIALEPIVLKKEKFIENVIDKRLNIGIKVPEWLELDKDNRKGAVLRLPVRSDLQAPIEEHLIVEFYSK